MFDEKERWFVLGWYAVIKRFVLCIVPLAVSSIIRRMAPTWCKRTVINFLNFQADGLVLSLWSTAHRFVNFNKKAHL